MIASVAPAHIDAILQSILGRGAERFGMAAAVLRGGRIIAQGAAGVRKRGTAERITIADRFHLGSCTKAMTATLVAMLVEEGKLNWTTTLGELFADTVKPMHPAWEKVTLRQVLAHRAGLPNELGGLAQVFNELVRPLRARLAWAMIQSVGTLPQQRLEIATLALSRPPAFPPDTKYWYSNVGYILAGAVLEQITGRAWEELMRERLFQPLGISTGGFGALPKTFGTDKTGQAWGHSPVLGKPLDPRSPAAELPLFYGPAGLAHMTITDWAKFIRLHLRGDPANPHCQAALLKLDTFAEMHAVAPGAFALNPVGTTSTSSQIHPANGDDVEVIPTRGGRSFMAREPAYSNGWVIRGLNWVAMGDAAPAVTYSAGWFISTASWARGTRHGDTGHYFWHGGRGGMSHSVVCIAPEIDFAVLVACNRDIAILKTRQALKALIRAFAPKRT